MRHSSALDTEPVRLRRFGKLRIPFATGLTWLLGAGLLMICAQIILSSRTIKYPAALIVASGAAAIFIVLTNKYPFVLFSVGFSLPFFVQYIFVQRDTQVFSVTGTFLSVLALAAIGIATGVIRGGRLRICPPITLAAVAFLCAGAASLVNTTDRTLTFIAIEREAELVLVFLILLNAIKEQRHLLSFMRGLYIGFGIECAIYVIQNILGFSFDILGNTRLEGATDLASGRIGFQRGTFGASPHTAAEYFAALTLLSVGLYLSTKKLRLGINPLVGIIAGFGCLALAAKRAPLAGYALGFGAICLLVALFAPWTARRLAPLVAALAIPVLILLPLLWLRTHQDNEGALEERMNLTRVAWDMYRANPLVGVGFGTYDTVKREYLPEDWQGWLYTVHNRYLLILAETGSVGFVSLLILYAVILWIACRGITVIDRDYRPLQISLVGIFAAFYWEMLWHMFDSSSREHCCGSS